MEIEESTENENQDVGALASETEREAPRTVETEAARSVDDLEVEEIDGASLHELLPISPIPEQQGQDDDDDYDDDDESDVLSLYDHVFDDIAESLSDDDDGLTFPQMARMDAEIHNRVESVLEQIEASNDGAVNPEEEEDEMGAFYGFSEQDIAILADNPHSRTLSTISLVDREMRGQPRPEAARWFIPQHHVNEAIGELISQAQRTEGGIAALIDRDNFMQRVRSMIFSLERNRNRHSTQSGSGDGGGQDGENNVERNEESSEADSVDEVMQSQSANDNVVENEFTVRFDTNLPAEHSYFGPNSNRVPGVNYLDVGNRYRMLIFMHQHLLFPGEVLPFMINGSIIDEEEENSALGGRDGIIFGVVFPFLQEPGTRPLKLYGVTCQIYERGEGGREMVFFKSRALQRFVVDCNELQGPPQYIVANPKVRCYGIAKILPENYLPEPLSCINMGSMNRFRDEPSMRDKFKRFQAASTPWPTHIYNDYNISDIITKAREKLEKHKIETMPTCPTQLSFWLVRNLHLTEKLMNSVFVTDSVNVRLKMIGRTLKGDALFFCRYCNNSIAECHELFAMSKYGVQSQYCNSAGYIHETNTVYRLLPDSVNYNGEESTEFSWFPGYQWRILVCKFCSQHIGWEYKAIEPNLVPKIFFGLAGTSVRVGKPHSPSTTNTMRPFVYRNLLRLVSRQME